MTKPQSTMKIFEKNKKKTNASQYQLPSLIAGEKCTYLYGKVKRNYGNSKIHFISPERIRKKKYENFSLAHVT